MKENNKYRVLSEEGEVLPNLLGLTSLEEIEFAETEELLFAEISIIENLSNETVFDLDYIYKIHKLGFERLYSFAGKLRTVNISKNGFLFPSAEFLSLAMDNFQNQILSQLPNTYQDENKLITDIAIVHAELLFIHPFREGNGRVARILSNAMAQKEGFEPLKFERITDQKKDEYIWAVQKAADKEYSPMEKIISFIF